MTGPVASADRQGNRRRLLLGNVLAYQERRRQRQYAMLAATAVDIDGAGAGQSQT